MKPLHYKDTKSRLRNAAWHGFVALVLCVCNIAAAANYAFDANGRLTSATYINGTQVNYTYDTAGNISAIANNSITQNTNPPPVFISTPTMSDTGNGSGGGNGTNPITFNFSWSTTTGSNYLVQYTTNLSPANWINLGTSLNATNGLLSASDLISTNSQRFLLFFTYSPKIKGLV